jgi:hypothetical protein
MANVIHDVSRELRDPHGKWTKGGAALRRMAGEAASARAPKSREEITGHVRNLQRGTGRTIGGHRIDRTQKDKYRVGLKTAKGRDTKLYDSPEHAAQALHEGKHHEAGGAARVAGGARTAAAETAVRKLAGQPAGRYTVKLVGPPNKDKTHYGVWDKEGGGWLRRDITQAEALNRAMQANAMPAPKAKAPASKSRITGDTGYTPGKGVGGRYRGAGPESKYRNMSDAELRNYEISRGSEAARQERLRREAEKASAPKGDERPYANTPESALREMVGRGGNLAAATELTRRIQAAEKARVEAENKATGRGGVTIHSGAGVGVGRPDLAGGAAPPKIDPALGKLTETDLRRMIDRRGYNWKGAERELNRRLQAQASVGRPAPGSMADKIARTEASFREEGISYTPQDLVATRLDSVLADLRSGDKFITIKVPSGSEISIPRDVAQELASRARQSRQGYLRGARR